MGAYLYHELNFDYEGDVPSTTENSRKSSAPLIHKSTRYE